MISEVNFAKNHSSFWTEYTPWSKDYVHSLNSGLVEHLYASLEEKDDPKYRSVNNVMAFTLFKNIACMNNNDIDNAFVESVKILKNYPRTNLDTYQLADPINCRTIKAISDRLIYRYKDKNTIFYPQFNGCGILDNCQGDLFSNQTLIEIKAGDRNITVQDLRQLLIYSALNWLSGACNIYYIELFNPRTGHLWNASIQEFISSISDLSMEELFEQIGKYLSDLSEDVIYDNSI